MPTRLEEICRQIHVLFAKGEAYQNSPDLVILSKTEMFSLLEQLNEAVYEVLDQYEASTRAKERARLETEREASEIIGAAKLEAEDINANSLTYADTMLDELNSLVETAKETVRRQYQDLLAYFDDKQEKLSENRSEIKEQLSSLHDGESYLELLKEVRLRREKKAEEEAKEKEAEQIKTTAKDNNTDTRNNDGSIAKKDGKAAEMNEVPAPKQSTPVIRVNRPGENPGVTFTTRRSHNKKSKTAPPKSSGVKPMSEEAFSSLSPEEQEALEQSTPAYGQGYNAEDFDLDAEYEQFKREKEAAKQDNSTKKGGFSLFKKKKR